MASIVHLLSIFLSAFLLISPAISHNCPAPNSGNCIDLPSLKSSLQWTYNSKNSTLSIVFSAPLPSSDGWVSWGINPTSPAMIGTEALIALKAPNGSMIIKTYSLTSYKSITQTDKLSFKVLNSKAEYSNADMKISATLVLPANTTTINQVWQVGSVVKDGLPMAHRFEADNLKSKGTLNLVTPSGGNGKNATATVPAPAPAPAGGNNKNGSSRNWSNIYVFVMFFGVLFL